MLVQLTIPAANVAALLTAGFTTIEVWRSTDSGNFYGEVTASTAQAAFLVSSPATTTFFMAGKLLKLRVDGGAEQSITFNTVVEHWTPTQVVNRINEVVPGLASVSGSSVALTSPTTGRTSSLEITFNDATDLGLPAGSFTYGKSARIPLVPDAVVYSFQDAAGSSNDRYKWRFSADGVNPISEFSPRVFGSSPPLDPDIVAIATATFINLEGRAYPATVIIASDGAPALIAGFVTGTDIPLTVTADANGFLQVPLVRGAVVRIAIEGTTFVREVRVPDEDSFDLLTALASAPDPFSVQVPLPFLIRRSL